MLRPLLAVGLLGLLVASVVFLFLHEPGDDAAAALTARRGEVGGELREGTDLNSVEPADLPGAALVGAASAEAAGRVEASAASDDLVLRLVPPDSTGERELEVLRGATVRLQRWEQQAEGSARFVENRTIEDWDDALEARWPGAGRTKGLRSLDATIHSRVGTRRGSEDAGDLLWPDQVRSIEVVTADGRRHAEVRLGTPYVAVARVVTDQGGAPAGLEGKTDPWDPAVAVLVACPTAGDQEVRDALAAIGGTGTVVPVDPVGPAFVRVRGDRWREGALVLSCPGFESVRLPLPEVEDGAPVVDLGSVTMTRPPSISGRVVDASGRPVEDAFVSAGVGWPFTAGALAETRTDAEGRFELAPPSDVDVVVAGHGATLDRILGIGPVEVGRSRGPLELVARTLPWLTVEVTNPAGRPVGGRLTARLRYLGGEAEAAPTSVRVMSAEAADGELHLSGLERGRWEVELSRGKQRGKATVEIGDGDVVTAIQLAKSER